MHHLHDCNRTIHGKRRVVSFQGAAATYGSAEARRRVWDDHGLQVLCYVVWNYPARPASENVRVAAYRDFFRALPARVPRDTNPEIWHTSVSMARLFGRSGRPPSREAAARHLIRAYGTANRWGEGDIARTFARVCAHMDRVRPRLPGAGAGAGASDRLGK